MNEEHPAKHARAESAGDARADRRDQRRQAARERMQKHGAGIGEVYRNAILKHLKKKAGAGRKKRRKR